MYDTSKHWSLCKEDEELGISLQTQLTAIMDDHKPRLDRIVKALSAYDNLGYGSVFDAVKNQPSGDWDSSDGLTFNILQSALDTLLSKVGKNKILPRIITTNAKWMKRNQAKKVERFVRGLFQQLKVNDVMLRALFSTLLHGDGFVKICSEPGNMWLELALVDEIYVDYTDGMKGTPSTMYQVKWKDKHEVCCDYPEMEDDIEACYTSAMSELRVGLDIDIDLKDKLAIIEAWKLPYKDKEPGRHVISCGSVVLLDEEWDRPYFPFVHMQYYTPERGYYSKGMHHNLSNLQKELDFTFATLSQAQRLCGSPKIFTTATDDMSPVEAESTVTNKVGEVVRLKNARDFQVYVPPPLNSERFAYVAQLKNYGFEQCGVSMLSATSRLPTGIDGASGKALREYNDIETERFALLAQDWEKVHKTLGEILINECARNPSFVVKCYDRRAPLVDITFADLRIRLDKIVVDIYPASALPARPEAKLATLQEWMQIGFIDKANAMELMDMPDLDAFAEIDNAPKGCVDKYISLIVEKRKKLTVEPFMDLEYLAQQATNYYNYVFGEWDLERTKTQQVLDLLRQTIEEVNTMLEGLNAPTPQAGPAIQGTPELAGMAAAGGEMLPEGVGAPALPPDAMALLGGGM